MTAMSTRTITLTRRRPVTIDTADWPEIACAGWDSWTGSADKVLYDQASGRGEIDRCTIRVRKHADGRRIIYGTYTEGVCTRHDGLARAGELLAGADGTEAAIARVGSALGAPARLIAECIASLAAEEI